MFLTRRRPGYAPARRLAIAAATFAAGLAAGTAVGPTLNGASLPATASAALAASTSDPPAPRPAYPADVLRVVDGDTFHARVHIWPGIEIVTKVRLRGIDAPEHRGRCEQERKRAQAAHDALASLLAEGEVAVARVALDKFGGRVLAQASTRQVADVAAALLATGLVRRYAGGRRKGWCERR